MTGIDSGSRKLLESSRMAIPAASLPRQILAAVLRRPYRTLSIAQIAHQAEKPWACQLEYHDVTICNTSTIIYWIYIDKQSE